MKRNRNTFFSNYNAQIESFIPNGIQQFDQNPYTQNNNQIIELENRISKLERQINRLDNRLSNLENNNITTETKDTYNNMYML